MPYKMSGPTTETPDRGARQKIAPSSLAEVLRKMRRRPRLPGRAGTDAVITVRPTSTTRAAGTKSRAHRGLEVKRIINEPTAAACFRPGQEEEGTARSPL